jgi:hypothetical protein
MADTREKLGQTQATSGGHTLEIELAVVNGEFEIVGAFYSDDLELLTEGGDFTKTRRVRKEMEYVGNPSLIERLLGRAEKRECTNAENFVQDVVSIVIEHLSMLETGHDIEVDEDAVKTDFEEQIFPISSWANLEHTAVQEKETDVKVVERRMGF